MNSTENIKKREDLQNIKKGKRLQDIKSKSIVSFKSIVMSTIRNQVQLIGNVGQDPTVTTLESGKKVARISLATNEHYKNAKGEKVENTQWHQMVAWGKNAEIIEAYVTKGKELAVKGKLSHRQYDTEEGERRYITEVELTEILLLGSK